MFRLRGIVRNTKIDPSGGRGDETIGEIGRMQNVLNASQGVGLKNMGMVPGASSIQVGEDEQ